MKNIAQNQFLAPACVAAVGYLILVAFSDSPQSTLTLGVEVFLAASYFSRLFWKYHFVGIRRSDLPDSEALSNCNCDEFEDSRCKELCHRIKQLLEVIEHSGKIGSNGKTAWKVVKYGAGAGGIGLALAADSVLLGGLGAALCLPSVVEWAEEDREQIHSLNEKVLELNDLYREFKERCLSEIYPGAAADV